MCKCSGCLCLALALVIPNAFGQAQSKSGAQPPEAKGKPSASAWTAIAALPELTGVWEVTRGGGAGGGRPEAPALTPKYADMLKTYQAHPPQDSAAANCVPPGMPSVMTQPYPVEFLMTPGKVTVVIEA